MKRYEEKIRRITYILDVKEIETAIRQYVNDTKYTSKGADQQQYGVTDQFSKIVIGEDGVTITRDYKKQENG